MDALRFLEDLAIVLTVGGVSAWISRRLGLSVVVGFLLAGIAIGPHTPPFALVSDLERVQTLAQLGLVFLMFWIGMGLSLSRMRRLGAGMLVAVAVEAFLVFNGSRLLAVAMGWTAAQGLFLAGMLMVGSSAIISKVLRDFNQTHQQSGQLALGLNIMEDLVAVVMLTLLSSTARISGETPYTLGRTIGFLLAFVTVLVVGGLLLMPRLLGRLKKSGGLDLQTVVLVGVLLAAALISVKAGFSLALGAFLTGAIIADTPQREEVERSMQGLHDVFSAVFFVSVGMLVDVSTFREVWPMILLVAAAAIVGRSLAATTGFVMIGIAPRDAIQTGLIVTAIGEFSFIIAEMGIVSGILEKSALAVVVGASLLTAIAAPLLTRHAAGISSLALQIEPKFLRDLAELYHRALADLRARGESNLLWKLGRKRLGQIGIGLLFVTGMLVVSSGVWEWLKANLPKNIFFAEHVGIVYWISLSLVVLVPLFAVWRNISAMAMLVGEVITRGHRYSSVTARVVERSLQAMAGVLLAIWIWLLLPFDLSAIWTVVFVVALLLLLLVFLRHRLIRVHSRVELELREALEPAAEPGSRAREAWMRDHRGWNLNIYDVVLPDRARCAGRTLADLELRTQFGCSVVGIERQGYAIPNPPPDIEVYPRDKMLLLTTPERIEAAKSFLDAQLAEERGELLDGMSLEAITVPEGSACVGKSLVEFEIPKLTGVQIAGIERGQRRVLNPGPFQGVEAGDRLLVTGSGEQTMAFKRWLARG